MSPIALLHSQYLRATQLEVDLDASRRHFDWEHRRSSMSRLIAVALYHRDHFSQGSARRAFGPGAYHWAIVVMSPEGEAGDRRVFDATDASNIDPTTFRLINPAMDWWFRAQETEDPSLAAKLMGHLIIGEVPLDVPMDELKHFFAKVPLPVKDSDPQENSVTWVAKAIQALQRQGWVPELDLEQLKSSAVAYADERLRSEPRELDIKHFTDLQRASTQQTSLS
ncbi:hypothetical protein NLU13_4246 [Sarocladium strictum]|uniref:Uncharacterized protein n=1 Tax=Sarocladium strictum TaxID=5046 RepID=A0AA39GL32_SARSR|nr:hypothetical protein NLU13_4246 [Sarocladium strictum]